MIFESTYRRKALDKWESEQTELKEELKAGFEQSKKVTKNPLTLAITAFLAWFFQQ
ncbi:hypothetical protein [Caldalkalibacillus mannanilyticus]|uniref:hypothetical protein n=1 Tax=Caldalkalibacillus mannanilyticus TaxID=1418 RepID=UPI000B020DE8|nr:hypothetical protein [Caldalkalibacillus mannanilyticus]